MISGKRKIHFVFAKKHFSWNRYSRQSLTWFWAPLIVKERFAVRNVIVRLLLTFKSFVFCYFQDWRPDISKNKDGNQLITFWSSRKCLWLITLMLGASYPSLVLRWNKTAFKTSAIRKWRPDVCFFCFSTNIFLRGDKRTVQLNSCCL